MQIGRFRSWALVRVFKLKVEGGLEELLGSFPVPLNSITAARGLLLRGTTPRERGSHARSGQRCPRH